MIAPLPAAPLTAAFDRRPWPRQADAAWLIPFLERLVNGDAVRIAAIEHAPGRRPDARRYDGHLVPPDPTWTPPPRRRRQRLS